MMGALTQCGGRKPLAPDVRDQLKHGIATLRACCAPGDAGAAVKSSAAAGLNCINCKIETDTAYQFFTVFADSLGNRNWARWRHALSA